MLANGQGWAFKGKSRATVGNYLEMTLSSLKTMLTPRRSLFEDSINVALVLNVYFTSSLVQCFYVDLTSLSQVFFLLAVSVILSPFIFPWVGLACPFVQNGTSPFIQLDLNIVASSCNYIRHFILLCNHVICLIYDFL